MLILNLAAGYSSQLLLRDRAFTDAGSLGHATVDLYLPFARPGSTGQYSVAHLKWQVSGFRIAAADSLPVLRSRVRVTVYGEDAPDDDSWESVGIVWDLFRDEGGRDTHYVGLELGARLLDLPVRFYGSALRRSFGQARYRGTAGLELPITLAPSGAVLEFGSALSFLVGDPANRLMYSSWRTRLALRVPLPMAQAWLHATYTPRFEVGRADPRHEAGVFVEVPLLVRAF
jgi:hypothetical protein